MSLRMGTRDSGHWCQNGDIARTGVRMSTSASERRSSVDAFVSAARVPGVLLRLSRNVRRVGSATNKGFAILELAHGLVPPSDQGRLEFRKDHLRSFGSLEPTNRLDPGIFPSQPRFF